LLEVFTSGRFPVATPQSGITLCPCYHVCIVSILVILATRTSAMIGTPARTMIRTLV
jgi:hypothetical protein